jgi:hypothetical protein
LNLPPLSFQLFDFLSKVEDFLLLVGANTIAAKGIRVLLFGVVEPSSEIAVGDAQAVSGI